MRILKVSGHACIRVHKEAIPLVNRGHEVHIIANRLPVFFETYRTVGVCGDTFQYSNAIELFADKVDLFHVHNEPSWFVTAIKEITNKPVLLDVHDSFLVRITPEMEDKRIEQGKRRLRIYNEERNNFQLADALVFPSKTFAEKIMNEYNLTQPALILESMMPETLYVYDCKEHIGGLVYEGRVDLTEEIEKNEKLCGFVYCNYEQMAKECAEVGLDFHIMANRNDKRFIEVYDSMSFVHKPYAYDVLLKKLSSHDWGLVGNIFQTSEWDVAMPNKLFEYMAACVPIVGLNAKACGDFIEEHGIGIAVKSVKELAERWKEHRRCRENLIKVRRAFTMEKHIHKLENLYQTAFKKEGIHDADSGNGDRRAYAESKAVLG